MMANQKHLHLKVSKLQWTQNIAPTYHDIMAIMQYKDRQLVGRGSSESDLKSMAIAFTEVLERTVVADGLRPDSNGIAAHTIASFAEQSAKRELIERDAFIVSYICGLPVKILALEDLALSPSIAPVLNHLYKNGIEVKTYALARSFNSYITMSVVNGLNSLREKFGVIVGLGCQEALAGAATGSLREALRNGVWAVETPLPMRRLTIEEFRSLNYVSCDDHLSLALDCDYGSKFQADLNARIANEIPIFPDVGSFEYSQLPLNEYFAGAPVIVCAANNKSLQNPIWGKLNPEAFNWNRLDIFGDLARHRAFNIPPHPLG
jgi:hypothetical protein